MNEIECVRVERLCKKFRKFTIDDVNFSLDKGYIMGVIGKNGAGKTTIMRLLNGVYSKSKGDIFINGFKFEKQNYKMRQMIGFVTEDNIFFGNQSLLDNCRIFGRFYDNFDIAYFRDLLKKMNLNEDQMYDQLSKGMKTKFNLSFVLAYQPKLLLLDEPTGGLDPLFRQEFLRLLQELVEDEKMGIIISTHITTDLDKIADYIMIVDKGKVISYSSKEELMERYRLVKGPRQLFHQFPSDFFVSAKNTENGFEALASRTEKIVGAREELVQFTIEIPTLSDILYYLTKNNGSSLHKSSESKEV